jgi:antibiotic biosynthesis monooxygenase (ABM) superfamily enzyme
MVVLKVLKEFAGGTSLHGFGFLVSPKSSPRTKIIWAISLIVAIIYASSEMRNSVIGKYTRSLFNTDLI